MPTVARLKGDVLMVKGTGMLHWFHVSVKVVDWKKLRALAIEWCGSLEGDTMNLIT